MSHSGANTTTPSTITRNDRIDLNEHESTTDDIPLISELFQQKANHEEIQHSVLTPEQLETKKKVTESYIRAFCIKGVPHCTHFLVNTASVFVCVVVNFCLVLISGVRAIQMLHINNPLKRCISTIADLFHFNGG